MSLYAKTSVLNLILAEIGSQRSECRCECDMTWHKWQYSIIIKRRTSWLEVQISVQKFLRTFFILVVIEFSLLETGGLWVQLWLDSVSFVHLADTLHCIQSLSVHAFAGNQTQYCSGSISLVFLELSHSVQSSASAASKQQSRPGMDHIHSPIWRGHGGRVTPFRVINTSQFSER